MAIFQHSCEFCGKIFYNNAPNSDSCPECRGYELSFQSILNKKKILDKKKSP